MALVFKAIRWDVKPIYPDPRNLLQGSHTARAACLYRIFNSRLVVPSRIENVMIFE
ncbi:hypothetical protein GJ699_18005 [Duganella sp. FT80W]|uniref:Uncharacterized protein n=1 Tax=Duganella guangzhouensis TaxID=2666084 RepID=A0A6I2L263_9BURK|nr:hypothetical protein [Duganella guangzhouensis]MRW91892.1 hypothetical protein [Duganella guangzhouensis]